MELCYKSFHFARRCFFCCLLPTGAPEGRPFCPPFTFPVSLPLPCSIRRFFAPDLTVFAATCGCSTRAHRERIAGDCVPALMRSNDARSEGRTSAGTPTPNRANCEPNSSTGRNRFALLNFDASCESIAPGIGQRCDRCDDEGVSTQN